MEFDMFEVFLCHGEHIVGVCQEDVTPFAVFCHVLILAFLEIVQFFLVVCFNPAGFV